MNNKFFNILLITVLTVSMLMTPAAELRMNAYAGDEPTGGSYDVLNQDEGSAESQNSEEDNAKPTETSETIVDDDTSSNSGSSDAGAETGATESSEKTTEIDEGSDELASEGAVTEDAANRLGLQSAPNSENSGSVKIGDNEYQSIDEAVEENPSGTIKIVSGSVIFNSDITSGSYKIDVLDDATLICESGAKMGPGENPLILVEDGGNLVVNGGSFDNSTGSNAVKIKEGGNAEFHGGTFIASYEVVLVNGTVSVIDGGVFKTPENNTNNKAAAVCVSGSDARIETISGGEFTGQNTGGGGSGLFLEDGARVETITGGTYYGGTNAETYPSGGQNGFGIRVGKNPGSDTSSVGNIAGGTYHAARCIEFQTKTECKITKATCEGFVDDDGEPKSVQGIHVDYTGNVSIENVEISNVKVGIANYGRISYVKNAVISDVITGINNQSIIGTITGGSIKASETGISLRPYSRTAEKFTATVEEINTDVNVADGSAIEVNGGTDYDSSVGEWVPVNASIGTISGGNYTAAGASTIVNSSGHIGTIGAIKAKTDCDYVIKNFSEDEDVIGTIDLIDGMEATHIGDYWADAVIRNSWNSKIGEIKSGTFDGGDVMALRNQGTITTISGGEFTTQGYYNENGGDIGTISGGKFTASGDADLGWDALINNGGTIGEISGGEFTGAMRGIRNYSGKIGTVSGGKFTGKNGDGIRNQSGEITTISDGEFSGSANGIRNEDTIGDITGGKFIGGNNGLYNDGATIDTITGGIFKGENWFGIYSIDYTDNDGNTYDASIGEITIGDEKKYKDGIFEGGYAAIASYNGGELGPVTGYGVFKSGSWGDLYTGSDVDLEKTGDEALNGEVIGFGRYQENDIILNPADSWKIPADYHMSVSDTTLNGETGKFHFLVKDKTIIFDGNGHAVKSGYSGKGTKDGNERLAFTYEATDADVDLKTADNDSGRVDDEFNANDMKFIGWNTKADGSGTEYGPEDIVSLPKDASGKPLDITLYAQWGGLNVTHYHDYLMGYTDNGLAITGNWFENKQVYEKPSYTLKDLVLAMGEEESSQRKITVEDPETLGIGSVTEFADCKYKLTKVTVNDHEVSDFSKVYKQTENNKIKFYYEMVKPIVLTIYGADYTGEFTGKDHEIKGFASESRANKTFGTLTLVGEATDGRTKYRIHAGASKDDDWSPDMKVRYAGEGQVVPSTWTVNDDGSVTAPEGWTKNDDGSYTVPESEYRLFYGFSPVYNKTGSAPRPALPMPFELRFVPGTYKITESDIVYKSENESMGSVSLGSEKVGSKDSDLAGSKAEPKTRYHFVNWTDADGNVVSKSARFTPEKVPGTYTAHFAVNQYTITFDSNGGSAVDPITQDYGTDVKAPADPTREGYTFDGWDKAIPKTMPAEDMTIKAKWKAVQKPAPDNQEPAKPQKSEPSKPAPAAPDRPATSTPAATPAPAETIAEEPTPEAEAPEAEIPESKPPKAEIPEEESWPLVNVICCIATALGAIIALFRRKGEDEEDDDEDADNRRKARIAKIVGIAAAVASVIALFVTEDFEGVMAMVDKWTILMAVILAVQVIAAIFGKVASKAEDAGEGAEDSLS